MKKSNKTKNTIMLSITSIIISIAVLVGVTFAWFTDTQESGKNKIQLGNLAVELYHSNNKTERKKVDETTLLFDIDTWEPGVMTYENFEVLNKGDLALKYDLSVLKGEYNTVAGTTKSLLDVLKVAVIEDSTFTGTREELKNLNFQETLNDFKKSGALNLKDSTDKFTVVIYWEPTETDDEYNLNNGKTSSDGNPLSIELGIVLEATQSPYENDSFGSDYDDMTSYTEVSSANEFLNNIYYATEDEGVKLTQDIEFPYYIPQSINGLTKIDLNGHKIKVTVNTTTPVQNSNMIIKNGTLELQSSKISSATMAVYSNSSLTLKNVEYIVNSGAGIMPYGENVTVNIIDSTMTTNGIAISTNANNADQQSVNINIKNSTINATKTGAGTPILINIPATTNIENSTVNGYLQGIIARGGTLTIKDSTINNTVGSSIESWEDYTTKDWGQGNMVTAATLVIGNKHDTAYKYPTAVTLINTKINSDHTDETSITVPTVYIVGNKEEGLGATLKYDSKSQLGEIVRGNEFVTVSTIK